MCYNYDVQLGPVNECLNESGEITHVFAPVHTQLWADI